MSNIPEGATHENIDFDSYYKFVDGKWFFTDPYHEWQPSHCSDEWITKNLTPLQPTQWLPEVGQECEIKVDELSDFLPVSIQAFSHDREVVFVKEGGDYNYFYVDDTQFRPLKTEREKFIERSREGELAIANEVAYEKILGAAYDKGARFND